MVFWPFAASDILDGYPCLLYFFGHLGRNADCFGFFRLMGVWGNSKAINILRSVINRKCRVRVDRNAHRKLSARIRVRPVDEWKTVFLNSAVNVYRVRIGDGQGRDRGGMGSTLYAASKMKCDSDSGKSFKLFSLYTPM